MKVKFLIRLVTMVAVVAICTCYASAERPKTSNINAGNPLEEYEASTQKKSDPKDAAPESNNNEASTKDAPDSKENGDNNYSDVKDAELENPDGGNSNSNLNNSGDEGTGADDKGGIDMSTLIIAILVVVIIVCIFMIFSQKKSRDSSDEKGKDPDYKYDYESGNSTNIRHMQQLINTMSTDIENLKSKTQSLNDIVLDLSRKVTNLSQNVNVKNDNKSQENKTVSLKPASQTLYAEDVEAAGFRDSGISKTYSPDAIAVITVQGKTGSYIINPDKAAQNKILSQFVYTAGRISEIIEQSNTPTSIQTVKPGRIEYVNGMWKILQKAQVKLV